MLSGDLISDVTLHHLADLHRTRHSSLTVLLKDSTAPNVLVSSAASAPSASAAALDSKHGAGKGGKDNRGAASAAAASGKNKGAAAAAAAAKSPAFGSSSSSGSSSGGGAAKKSSAMDDLDKQFIGLDEKSNRLVLFKSASDVEDGFTVTKALLRR